MLGGLRGKAQGGGVERHIGGERDDEHHGVADHSTAVHRLSTTANAPGEQLAGLVVAARWGRVDREGLTVVGAGA